MIDERRDQTIGPLVQGTGAEVGLLADECQP
jgi:hypothetical protein